MVQIEVVDKNVGWDERHFPAPPPVSGYAPRALNEHESALEDACARLSPGDESTVREVCEMVEKWARSCPRSPHFTSFTRTDEIVRYIRTKVLDFVERKYSPCAIVDETRILLKTAGLDPG